MRGYAFLFATTLTLGYGFAAQAAISANRFATGRRVTRDVPAAAKTPDADRVWYGGTLAPITVEARGELVRVKTSRKVPDSRCTVA